MLEVHRRAERGLELAAVRLEDVAPRYAKKFRYLGSTTTGMPRCPRPANGLLDHLGHQHALVVVLEHQRVGALHRAAHGDQHAFSILRQPSSRRPPPRPRARPAASARATRVLVVVGRSTSTTVADVRATIVVEHRRAAVARAVVGADRATTSSRARPGADVLRHVGGAAERVRAARARAPRARAPRARCARRRRAGRRRASRRRSQRSGGPQQHGGAPKAVRAR